MNLQWLTALKPPVGYRYAVRGERIEKGDIYWTGRSWLEIKFIVGERVNTIDATSKVIAKKESESI